MGIKTRVAAKFKNINAPSFDEVRVLRDSGDIDLLHLELKCYEMSYFESIKDLDIDHNLDHDIASYISLTCEILDYQYHGFQHIHLVIREVSDNDLKQANPKFPLGYITFPDKSVSEVTDVDTLEVVLYCRSEVLTRVCSLINESNRILPHLLLQFPELDDTFPVAAPIMGYSIGQTLKITFKS